MRPSSQVGMLTEEIDSLLTARLRARFSFDTTLTTVGMIASIVGTLLLTAVMATHQLISVARAPILRLTATRTRPDLSLRQGQSWHGFLSHSARNLSTAAPLLLSSRWSRHTSSARHMR